MLLLPQCARADVHMSLPVPRKTQVDGILCSRRTAFVSAAQAGRASAEEGLRAAQEELHALKEQQRLDFERIGLLSEEHAALQVLFTVMGLLVCMASMQDSVVATVCGSMRYV